MVRPPAVRQHGFPADGNIFHRTEGLHHYKVVSPRSQSGGRHSAWPNPFAGGEGRKVRFPPFSPYDPPTPFRKWPLMGRSTDVWFRPSLLAAYPRPCNGRIQGTWARRGRGHAPRRASRKGALAARASNGHFPGWAARPAHGVDPDRKCLYTEHRISVERNTLP